jgi:hypothetical protein
VTREYTIQRGGIALRPATSEEEDIESVPQLPFSSYYGVLARSPARRSPLIEEHVIAGKELPETEALAVEDGRNDGKKQRPGTNNSARAKRGGGRSSTGKAKKNGNKK